MRRTGLTLASGWAVADWVQLKTRRSLLMRGSYGFRNRDVGVQLQGHPGFAGSRKHGQISHCWRTMLILWTGPSDLSLAPSLSSAFGLSSIVQYCELTGRRTGRSRSEPARSLSTIACSTLRRGPAERDVFRRCSWYICPAQHRVHGECSGGFGERVQEDKSVFQCR